MEGSEKLASRVEIGRQTYCYAKNCVRIFIERIREVRHATISQMQQDEYRVG